MKKRQSKGQPNCAEYILRHFSRLFPVDKGSIRVDYRIFFVRGKPKSVYPSRAKSASFKKKTELTA
jgi:hypothetical protein